jgi:hypothetical protein
MIKVEDIQTLAEHITDNWSLCNFLNKSEKEYIVATTIHACLKNYEKTGEIFALKGRNLNLESRLVQNHSSYNSLLDDGFLEEFERNGEQVIRPTEKLIDKLKQFFKIQL